MSSMQEDILALREPIFAVRPSVAFGLDEKAGLKNAPAGDSLKGNGS